ncbi:gamma carbonic anhydrase family protein [Kineothrix sp. MB12-C1]|uniref:gamma carbonic anhydrase family protein n=1 Tax=Kineothrix sp. MB12-C1 TaxID=3070215 RepID=UPI0027D2BD48|nr:gamma carbonic anhydrase family protein [Kineothrix sp. MB12-C1]WMC93117.1 gamma carbonic anhydrase family protein [Kineothrix sp. MB12-C1]
MEEGKIHSSAFIAQGAIVLGDVRVGEECSIWFHATVRADRDEIIIGNRSNIQDNAVVHVETDFPVYIGENVTVGHSAIVHGSTIGDNTLVGMGAIILNGAKVGKNCIIGAGALVPQNMVIPDDSLVIGCPGKILRKVTEEERRASLHNAMEYAREGQNYKT